MHIIHQSHTCGPPRLNEQPFGWLEIRRGATRFPRRPVHSSRFLIGSGTNCHLQLGGDLPLLHSLLLLETAPAQEPRQDEEPPILRSSRWIVEAVTPWPELSVNGAGCRRCILADGDLVQMGPFVLRWTTSTSTSGKIAVKAA